LKGDMAYAITHPGGDRLNAEVVTVPDGLEQCDAGGRHPQADTAQFLGGGRSLGCGHGAKPYPHKHEEFKTTNNPSLVLLPTLWRDVPSGW